MQWIYLALVLLYLLFPIVGFRQMQHHRSSSEVKATPSASYTQGKQLLVWGLVAPAIALLSIVPLMGLPGGILMSAGQLFGLNPALFAGDKAWPAAIFASLIFPLALPLGVVLKMTAENIGWKLPLLLAIGLMLLIWGAITIGLVAWMARQA
ncbi:MAG: hypothetical protein ACK4TA_06860 [Saprospiraceae bacterium]